MSSIVIFLLFVSTLILAKKYLDALKISKKYEPIVDLEKAIQQAQYRLTNIEAEANEGTARLNSIKSELSILQNDHDLITSGFYKPRYDFADSKEYADKLKDIRDRQKELIKKKEAVVCSTQWSVGGSKAEGKKMTDRIIKLGLSAFNVQCDNEILSVSFDNIDRSQAKLEKIKEVIDKLLEPNFCKITQSFFQLKLEELFLAYEYAEKVAKEKEEQKALKEQAREEEKARREAERAEAEAAKDERRYETALEEARKELARKSASEKEAFALKIAELENQLKAAHEKKERAKSLAEETRRGHVYIISNIGSFGEKVFKIGMTRRLDPMDRIWELGDASVPFDFDVHALIPSEDAPGLESKLHEIFTNKRINKVNERKEFFKVSIEEIAEACHKANAKPPKLTLIAEAKEYRQTLALENKEAQKAA